MRKWWIYRWITNWTKQYLTTVWDYPNNIVSYYNQAAHDKEYVTIGLSFLSVMTMILPMYLLLTPIALVASIVLTLLGKLIIFIVSSISRLRQH